MLYILGILLTSLYVLLNYYVGLRILQSILLFSKYTYAFWIVYVGLALSPFLPRISSFLSSGWPREVVTYIGDYWLASFYYFLLLWTVFDFLSITAKLLKVRIPLSIPQAGVSIILIIAFILIHGTYAGKATRVNTYAVNIHKKSADLSTLSAVLVSDIHLGIVIDRARLKVLVDKINELNPDIVFLAGDTINGNTGPFIEERMAEVLRTIKAPLGVFAVLGNHETMSTMGGILISLSLL
ncbi:MAG: metallophosphoesterase [bacterium]|nr:metallophosphoesterase [bacterium]